MFIDFQAQLNCEVLNADINLQLRWSLTEENTVILLQLVSNTGSDRYVAFGIKDNSNLGVSGDVLVGWINGRTKKGSIDDYFLGGESIKCDDGAESCPDSAKKVLLTDIFTWSLFTYTCVLSGRRKAR